MATFPSYAKIAGDSFSESHAPIVERTEMDRGVPKQRKTQSDVLVTLALKLLFLTRADAANFEDWYYTEAKAGAAFFDWTDQRTGAVRQARAIANTLGPLMPMGGGMLEYTTRTLQIEYLRAL